MNDSIQKALIFTGGFCHVENLIGRQLHGDYIIAADAGRFLAERCGIVPDLIVGDFDSSPLPAEATHPQILRVPAEKDETDTMLACRIAMEKGATQLLILGGTGGRIDHSLSNIFLLEYLREHGVSAVLFDGDNRVQLLQNETVHLAADGFRYFSLFALDDATVTETGCKYPLQNARLTRAYPYALSNEISEKEAIISVRGGCVLLIESDPHQKP